MTKSENKLIELYNKASKHSNYQLLHPRVAGLFHQGGVQAKSRHEAERLAYFVLNVDFRNKVVADIGGNTGYFTFGVLDHGAAHVHYFEGNQEHALFVEMAAKQLSLDKKVAVNARYVDFVHDGLGYEADVILLLNVLHHVGDDYGPRSFSRSDALAHISGSLANLARLTHFLVFQFGFNWKGDRNLSLFEHGTKAEMIQFVRTACDGAWDIKKIGVARREGQGIAYRDLDSRSIERDDSLGEFLNRPVFILSSRLR
jgi:hypothetical protein